MKIRRGKDIKLRWSVTVNDRPITADDDLTLVLINPRLEKIKLDYFIEDGALVFYFRGKDQKFLGEYKLTLWLNYGKENQTALDDTSCFTLVRFTDDEDNDLEDITEVELKGTVTISGDSAYEIWLKNGNTGTQTDFLESLKGKDGADGIDGKDGKDGLDANSAIEVVNQETNSAAQKGAINVKSTGVNSLAMGLNSIASGDYSVAMGRSNYASGRGGIALAGITYSIKFTGDAGTTTYVTTFQTWETPYLVGMPVYVNTTDVSEPAYITAATLNEDNKVVVTLDRTLNPNEAVNAVGWNPVFNIAKGTSSFASGGLVLGNQSAVLSGGRNIINGTHGLAGGYGNILEKNYAFSAGYCNRIKGAYGAALGRCNEAAESATALGVASNANGTGSLALGCGAITIYITATDTPSKYIIDPSWNISHNKFESLIKGGKVYEVENGSVSYSKPIAITDVEVVDGVYYMTTERELKNITSHTRLGLNLTKANGTNSVVFGNNAALGGKDFVAGMMNLSKYEGSVVFGYSNVSENAQNFINGSWLNTKNEFETALGTKNRTNTGATRAEQTIFSVGNGDDVASVNGLYQMGEGKNCLEIMRNGDIYFGGYGDGIKFYDAVEKKVNITPTTITNGTGTNSSLQVNAINCKATGVNSFAGGINSTADGDYSLAFGRFNHAKGRGSVALGGLTKGFVFTGVGNTYTIEITEMFIPYLVGLKVYKTTTGIEEPATITNVEKLEDGKVKVILDKSFSDVEVDNVKWYILFNVAKGSSAHAYGGLSMGNSSVTLGQFNIADNTGSVALGNENSSLYKYCLAVGYNNISGIKDVESNSAIAIGHTNKATGKQAIAMGYLNNATIGTAIAMGSTNNANGNYSIAMGGGNTTNGRGTVALGFGNVTDGECGVALGYKCKTTNDCEVAVGYQNTSHAKVDGDESTATIFSVGSGEGNAIEIMQNGDIYLGTYPNGAKLWDVATGTSPLVEEIVNKILTEKGVING